MDSSSKGNTVAIFIVLAAMAGLEPNFVAEGTLKLIVE